MLIPMGYAKSATTRIVKYVFPREVYVSNAIQVFLLVIHNVLPHVLMANTKTPQRIYASTVH
jgi:hypothetical protein